MHYAVHYCHYLVPEYFHPFKWKPHTHEALTPSYLLLISPGKHKSIVSLHLPILSFFVHVQHTICVIFYVCLLSLALMDLRLIHVVDVSVPRSILLLINIPLYEHICCLLFHLLMDILHCFRLLCIVVV